MESFFKKIVLANSVFQNFVFEKEGIMEPLSKLNIFVGANSSGKSRALRSIYFEKSLPYQMNQIIIEDFENLAKEIQQKIILAMGRYSLINGVSEDYLSEIINWGTDFNDSNRLIHEILKQKIQPLATITFNGYRERVNDYQVKHETVIIQELKNIYEDYWELILEMSEKNTPAFSKKIYFPVLRGMRPFHNNENFYLKKTLSDYFKVDSVREGLEIFTGLELYRSLKNKLLGEPEDREEIRNYETFLADTFFEGKTITLIPKENDEGVVHIKIGEEKQFPIYDLGDGIQNLIIMTFKVFIESESCLFFIEEPDLFMHPGMQRIFIEFLLSAKKHQFFLTTHSNHILDMSLDHNGISIFHFNKSINQNVTSFRVENVSNDKKRLLKDLGVLNSSVFLSNSTIWLEGITDRLYIMSFMKRYLEYLKSKNDENFLKFSSYKENLHYSFVEYQGSTLTHWAFSYEENSAKIRADFVCANAFLLADGDIASKGNRANELKESLEERFFLLPVKEIENTLPVECIAAYVAKKRETLDTGLIKRKNYSKPEVALGKYLDKIFATSKVFGEDSGTVKAKRAFCDSCIGTLENYNLDVEKDQIIIEICSKIFAHISRENGN